MRPPFGYLVLFAGSALALVNSLINYFLPWAGIDYTAGALLVLCTTAVLVIGGVVLIVSSRPRWLLIFLNIGIVIDIVGSGTAGYFLEAHVYMAFLGLALIGWFLHFWTAPARQQLADKPA